jgi:conjugal transfer/entry exclusion protein
VGAITEEFKTEVNNKITQVQNNLDVLQKILSESVASLRDETRQKLESTCERMNVLNERVTERM